MLMPLVLLLIACAPVQAQGAPAASDADTRCSARSLVTQARRIVAHAGVVLDDRVVDLPDTLPMHWRNEQVMLRYTIDVSACAAASSAALSVYRVGAPYQVRFDGAPVASLLTRAKFAASDMPAASAVFNGRIPNLFALPQAARSIDIDLLTLPYIPTGLAELGLGPTNALIPLAVADVKRTVGFTDAAAGVILVLALMAGTLWLHRRHDMGFLWMTLACVFWSIRALAYFDGTIYLPPIWFEQLNPYNILLTAIALSAATLAAVMPQARTPLRAPRPAR